MKDINRRFFGPEQKDAKIIQVIHDDRPQILCVGLGAPKQEYWMHDHIAEIAVPVSIGVGAMQAARQIVLVVAQPSRRNCYTRYNL